MEELRDLMEEQLVVGERRMDRRQEEDDMQMGLEAAGVDNYQEDEIVQEGLALELARDRQEEQERQRARGGRGGRDHGRGVHGPEPTGKQSWVCPKWV